MAIPPERISFKFQERKPSKLKLEERFYRPSGSSMNIEPIQQTAVAFEKNNELKQSLGESKLINKGVSMDIDKRLRRAMLDKEATLDKLAQARFENNEEAEEFYIKNAQILE